LADFDLFVIGGGSGGVACARRAASHGARVGIAESSRVGGTCVIRGCVPKKQMHYGAHFAEYFRLAGSYGWDVGTPERAFERLLENRNREISRLNGIYIRMLESAGVRLFEGHARLRPERDGEDFRVEVAGETATAARVLVAVGGRPHVPDGLLGSELAVTSDEVLEEVYPLPERLLVIGAGYIGVELASILHAFGSETTLMLRGEYPLRGFDQELRECLTAELEHGGLAIRRGIVPLAIRKEGNALTVETSGGPLQADKVILATGRRPAPNTEGLGLDAHGVKRDPMGAVCVDLQYRSSTPGIFAVGDASNHAAASLDGEGFDLTPIAIAEGRALAEGLFNDNPVEVCYTTTPTAVFGLPQASTVGLSEERARTLGHDITVYRTRFRPLLYTLAGAERRTMMKLVVERGTDRVLGCHMVGDDAGEIIQGFAVALTAGATKADFDRTVALHPTAAEEFVTMYQPAPA
jgi:glutathione reductase (NADPH)